MDGEACNVNRPHRLWTTLMQRLKHQQIKYDKTQAIEFSTNFIDTPGEYMEHHNIMRYLRTTAVDADIVVLLQSATDRRLVYPAGFCSMLTKPTLGLVTKIDQAGDGDIEYFRKLLLSAGVKKVIPISAIDGTNINEVRTALEEN